MNYKLLIISDLDGFWVRFALEWFIFAGSVCADLVVKNPAFIGDFFYSPLKCCRNPDLR